MPGKPVCATCKEPEKPEEPLKACGRCQLRLYCSKRCQTTDWIEGKHKENCVKLSQEALERVYREFKFSNVDKKRNDPNSISTDAEVEEFETFVTKHKPTIDDCECMDDRHLRYAKSARKSLCAWKQCGRKMPRQEQFSFSLYTAVNAPCKLSHAVPLTFCSLQCVTAQRQFDEIEDERRHAEKLPAHLQPPPPPASMLLSTDQ